MEHYSSSEQETEQIARAFAAQLKGGETIGLVGDLGAGKTTFVRGVVHAFGSTGIVRSPTFTLVNVYPVSHPVISHVVHADLYRLGIHVEIPELGLDEWIGRSDTVVFVEWPEHIKKTPDIIVRFSHIDEPKRLITW